MGLEPEALVFRGSGFRGFEFMLSGISSNRGTPKCKGTPNFGKPHMSNLRDKALASLAIWHRWTFTRRR